MLVSALSGLYAQKTKSKRPPGVIIDYSSASTGKYIGSPSLCLRSNEDYVASHDFFGPGAVEKNIGITVVFKSINKGKTWEQISVVHGQFWSTLFEHNDVLYLFGTDREYGNLIIRKSTDGGYTWTEPLDKNSGLLFAGKYHTAPVPIIRHNGYMWRAVEEIDRRQKKWGKMFMSSMFSANLSGDLMKASTWRKTNSLPYDSTYLKGAFVGWLEGNAVLDTNGNVVNLLRVSTQVAGVEKAAVVPVSDDGLRATFDKEKDFINFPGGSKKFSVRYDSITNLYWTLSNVIAPDLMHIKETGRIRNTIALCSSKDLRNWRIHKYILHHSDRNKHGFQYVDWQFEGAKNIVFVSRTAFDDAYGGAHRQHDANYLTFHRIKNFRKLKNYIK
ncbi:exo-alpha-sialidase [Sphingobacterium sp. SGG-5]|nr:exo-alpha-sialidase [Sphingobacterium sp. SGG-5]